MSSLRTFWSSRIEASNDLMLEQPYGHDTVITEVALADNTPIQGRVTLTASVETLLMDQPEVNGENQSIRHEIVIASFLPGEPRIKSVNLGFTSTDICYVQANGGALIVSGYIMKSSVKMADFAPQ